MTVKAWKLRLASGTALALGFLAVQTAALAPNADAAHHLIRISEVYPGSAANDKAEFVELQLGALNENQQMNSTSVRIYTSTGVVAGSGTTLTTPLGGGEDQSYLLAATQAATLQFGETADITLSNENDMDPAGGAVCFESSFFLTPPTGPGIDCMSWGTFAGGGTFPTNPGAATGTARAAFTDTFGTMRNIGPGCSTLMQPSIDDTNNSSSDFASNAPPDPQNSASPVTNTECLLTVTVNGLGSVTGSDINCPSDCTQSFFNGENVVLTANTVGGSTFSGWTSCSSEAGNQCTEDLNSSQFVTANFTGGSTGGGSSPAPTVDNSAACAELRAKVAKLSKRIKQADDPEVRAKLKKKRRKLRQQLAALGC